MAKFTQDPEINLEKNEKKGHILVKGTVSIEFEEHEKNVKWEFKLDVMDKKNNDEIVATVSKVITPKKITVTEKFSDKIAAGKFKEGLSEMDVGFKFHITHLD